MRRPCKFEVALSIGLSSAALFTGCSGNEKRNHGQYAELGNKYAQALEAALGYCEGEKTEEKRTEVSERIGSYLAERNFVIDEQDIGSQNENSTQAKEFSQDFPPRHSLIKELSC